MTTKYFRILIILIASALTAACSDSLPDGPRQYGDVTVDGDEITLDVTLQVPEMAEFASRALADKPAYSNLHLYLIEFDDNGSPVTNSLNHVYQAEQETVSGDIVTFRVKLIASESPKVLHLIAITNDEELSVEYGLEADIIPHMTVAYGTDAYWRRVSFPDGYSSEAEDGSWHPNDELINKLTKVQLVRNFAKITVTDNAPDFDFQGFVVMNVPTAGTIAPWNKNSLTFPQYIDASGVTPSYDVMKTTYSGILPSGTEFDNQVTGWDPVLTTAPQYLYERPYSLDRPTFIIICGLRNGVMNYYKLDLGKPDANGVFRNYNILRNFHYNVILTKVERDGYASAHEAANGIVSNNFSFSLDTNQMLNISDGKQIVYVSDTNLVLTNSEKEDTLQFKFKFRSVTDRLYYNDDTNVQFVGLDPGPVIKSATVGDTDDADGWRTVNIIVNKATSETKTQEFTIVNRDGLGRTIYMSLHKKWTYRNLREYGIQLSDWSTGASNSGIAGPNSGNPLTIFFDIPNDLPETVFPLTFILEADRQNIEDAPEGNMSVTEGPSFFPANMGETRIKYVKTITLQNYNTPIDKTPGTSDQGTIVYANDGKTISAHRVRCRMRTVRSLEDMGVAPGATINVRVWIQEEKGNFVSNGSENVVTFTRTRPSAQP